ncbi:hypothetical protein L3Q82_014245 [Scortum barcoo]|uniref:Uncharacterized protein n=1 Tax=Scortum barcoo TaxID=214431 RepID=A0ACB8VWT9_9TELE|nr:hypothetical protein L3Q82_014245 [Scortum barcoo]
MSHQEEAPGKTQDTLERLCLSAGLGMPRGPPRKSWRKCLGKSGYCKKNKLNMLSLDVLDTQWWCRALRGCTEFTQTHTESTSKSRSGDAQDTVQIIQHVTEERMHNPGDVLSVVEHVAGKNTGIQYMNMLLILIFLP